MLPFMMIELCAYGVFAGLLKDVKIPTIAKVLIAQIAGRAVRGIFTSILTGLFGILLQLIIIPLAVYRLKEADNE